MSEAPSRILVLGGTGMLGHEAARVLADDFDVAASVRNVGDARRHELPAELYAFDAARPEGLGPLLDAAAPDVALNCIGLVKQLDDASRPLPAISLNALFPHQLAEACRERGMRLIHVSTDCVFSGELPFPGHYTETDWPDPRDVYGRTKLLGEVADDPNALTLRTSIIGRELGRATGLLEWTLAQAGGEVRGFAEAYFSGLTTRALSRTIGRVVREHPDLSGLWHVSAEPVSKFDLLTAMDEAFGLGLSIERTEQPRINRSLDSSRFRAATGVEPPSWDAMIAEYAAEVVS